MPRRINRRDAIASLFGAVAAPGVLRAQSGFPIRPIRIVVPVAPGGGVDTFARLIAAKAKVQHDVQFVIENRTGGTPRLAASRSSVPRQTAIRCCFTLRRITSRDWC